LAPGICGQDVEAVEVMCRFLAQYEPGPTTDGNIATL
jgi:hypothetical protein